VTWYLLGAILLVGLWGVLAEGNLVRKVVGLSIANSAVTLLFVFFASQSGDRAPILDSGTGVPVDPVPHALMLTAIVVGICIVALALVLTYLLFQRFGTLELPEIESRVWSDDEAEDP
jgi:multicomponent Na+:H+ antiporter subunit C